jgi:galactose mutarotase-like enzyme
VTRPDEVQLNDGNATVAIAAHRGAIATRFDIGERHVLFMDAETLADPTKNVRGGVPVLFPTPGKLANDAWSYAGKSGSMKQHGFARNVAWRPNERTANSVVMSIESNDETRTQFPWDFTFDMTFTVSGFTLRLDQRIANTGSAPMPFGVGFHPYFQVPDADKPRTTVATAATRAFDNVTKTTIGLAGPASLGSAEARSTPEGSAKSIDLAQKEVDLHLLDHGSTESSLAFPGGTVRLAGSPEYTHWVVWTLAGRDFVCLEPWTCPGNALNTGDRLIVLAPGEIRSLWLEIGLI